MNQRRIPISKLWLVLCVVAASTAVYAPVSVYVFGNPLEVSFDRALWQSIGAWAFWYICRAEA